MIEDLADVFPNDPILKRGGLADNMPRAARVGDRIRFFGAEYVIDRIHAHPTLGEFFAMHDVVDGRYELISARGNDGNFEVLA